MSPYVLYIINSWLIINDYFQSARLSRWRVSVWGYLLPSSVWRKRRTGKRGPYIFRNVSRTVCHSPVIRQRGKGSDWDVYKILCDYVERNLETVLCDFCDGGRWVKNYHSFDSMSFSFFIRVLVCRSTTNSTLIRLLGAPRDEWVREGVSVIREILSFQGPLLQRTHDKKDRSVQEKGSLKFVSLVSYFDSLPMNGLGSLGLSGIGSVLGCCSCLNSELSLNS